MSVSSKVMGGDRTGGSVFSITMSQWRHTWRVALRHGVRLIASWLIAAMVIGCATTPGPTAGLSTVPPDQIDLDALIDEAIEHASSDPARAARLLGEVLSISPFHGPSHNNLGVVHLTEGDLHLAARSFNEARRLMPGHPDPRYNLGVVYSRAGRHNEALRMYDAALDLQPHHPPSLAGRASIRLQLDPGDAETIDALRRVAARPIDPVWQDWALTHLAQLDGGDDPDGLDGSPAPPP